MCTAPAPISEAVCRHPLRIPFLSVGTAPRSWMPGQISIVCAEFPRRTLPPISRRAAQLGANCSLICLFSCTLFLWLITRLFLQKPAKINVARASARTFRGGRLSRNPP